jgi:hypothetical protein
VRFLDKGDEMELDMSGKNMHDEGDITLVPEIIGNPRYQ